MADVSIQLNPASLCDRLRKMQSEMTEENRHDEAFLTELAISAIRALMEGETVEVAGVGFECGLPTPFGTLR